MGVTGKKKVLVGDDDKFIRDLLLKILTAEGYEVFAVKTGKEAFEYVYANPVDALITDVYMENGGGEELVEKMKISHPGIPIIVMTGDGSMELERDMRVKGVYAYFSKPIELEIFKRTLKAAIAAGWKK